MKNQVINVIEIKDGQAAMSVNSWILPFKDDNQHPYIRQAEELFAALLRAFQKANFGDREYSERLIKGHIEEGSYIRADYKLFLTWSESVASHEEEDDSEAIMKTLNTDKSEISIEALAFLQSCEAEYRDERLSEHLYSLETILEEDEFEQQSEAVQEEIRAIHSKLAAKDCGYLRITY